MPEWLVERGIGETRMVLIERGEIIEARIIAEGVVPAGSVLEAILKQVARPAIAVAEGHEFLLSNGAPGVTEGAKLSIEVTREWIGGAEPWKRAQARVTDLPAGTPPWPAGQELPFPAPGDALEEAGWLDLLDEARHGRIAFAGGELLVAVTPAMTLIDIDGTLAPADLAIAGARAAARAIRRHGIGGSIGIDLPIGRSKESRLAAARAVDEALVRPFERTTVNGFGFLQIVRRRTHASLFELAAQRTSFEGRALLRRAARWKGAARLVAHPAITTFLATRPDWIEALSRQIGGPVTLSPDANTSISAGHVAPV